MSPYNWFLPVDSIPVESKIPLGFIDTYGFKIGKSNIYSLLLTNSISAANNTNADAILTSFLSIPDEKFLKSLIDGIRKPLLACIYKGIKSTSKIINEIKKYEVCGFSGFYIGNHFPLDLFEKIRKVTLLHLIYKSAINHQEIITKHDAGTDSICLSGFELTPGFIGSINRIFPTFPVIASCESSLENMKNASGSGVDAIIFQPYIKTNNSEC